MFFALILAGLVSFAAGFVLRVGAFSIFAVLVSVVYLALTYQSGSLIASLAPVLGLFVVMQLAYLAGVLLPLPVAHRVSSWQLPFPKLQRRIDSVRKKDV